MEVDYKAIGKRIAAKRKALKLTQAELANACDVSDQYISNIERSTSIPSLEMIMKLSYAMDTTPDEFLVGTMKSDDEWRQTADLVKTLKPHQLKYAHSFLTWLNDEKL